MHCHLLIIYTEFGDINRRHKIIRLRFSRVESDQSVYAPKIEFAIARLQSRFIIELIPQQPVFCRKNTYIILVGMKANESAVRPKP